VAPRAKEWKYFLGRKKMKDVNKQIEDFKRNRPPVEDTVLNLYKAGFSIMESIKIIRAGYSIPLREAKQIVSSRKAWAEVVKNNQPLHDLLEEIFKCEQ
jgi:hypothetical protein